jgi:hypothetical protein
VPERVTLRFVLLAPVQPFDRCDAFVFVGHMFNPVGHVRQIAVQPSDQLPIPEICSQLLAQRMLNVCLTGEFIFAFSPRLLSSSARQFLSRSTYFRNFSPNQQALTAIRTNSPNFAMAQLHKDVLVELAVATSRWRSAAGTTVVGSQRFTALAIGRQPGRST